MARRASSLPSELGSHFSVSSARKLGVSSARLSRLDLEAPFHGARRRTGSTRAGAGGKDTNQALDPHERSRLAHCEAARSFLAVMPEGAVFCGITAAAIMKLRVTILPEQPVEVAVLAPRRAPRARGVRGIQVRRHLVESGSFGGMPVTSPAATWAMLAGRLSLEELIVLGDGIVHRSRIPGTERLDRTPIATVEDLSEMLARGMRPGIRNLRRALPRIRTGSASGPESLLRLALCDAGLPEPDLDVDVRDRNGRLIGASDLAYRKWRIAFEYEGDYHRIERDRWNRDIVKYQQYDEAEWKVIRVTARLLFRGRTELIRQARAAIAASS